MKFKILKKEIFDYVFLNVYGLYILVLFINNGYYYLYYIIVMRLYRDSQGVVEYVKQVISDLLCNRIDIFQLVIIKEFIKIGDEYVGKQVYVEFVYRFVQISLNKKQFLVFLVNDLKNLII